MMTLEVSNNLFVSDAPSSFVSELKATLTIENPEYLAAEKMGRWTGDTPQYLRHYEQVDDGIIVPRGLIGLVILTARRTGLPWCLKDDTRNLPEADFSFTGTLKPFQQEAVNGILKRDNGVLQAPTGAGKTVMALTVVAERKQSTLIIVHSKELLNQWIERIKTFLGIPAREVGVIGDGKRTIGSRITVGIVNSVYPIADDIKRSFGHIIVDECHRCPSRTFTKAVTAFDAKYILGLSATPWRRDGLTRLIGWYLGPQIKVDPGVLTEKDIIQNVEVVTRQTEFVPWADPAEEYSTMISELCEDTGRNELIADDVAKEVSNGDGTCLILSDRKNHCEALGDILRDRGITAEILTGRISDKARSDIVSRLNAGEVKILVATGQLIGEGFDAKSLQTIFLTTPVKFDGRLIQYLGRILRPAPGKQRAKVYDYIDPVGVLQTSARTRQRVYERNGWQQKK